MVPAAMCREAMVAVLCAVAAWSFAGVITPQAARADEPIPLGQTAPADDAQPASEPQDVVYEGGPSSTDPSGGDPWDGAPAWDPSTVTFEDWLENAYAFDWAWLWDDGSASTPADPAPPDPAPADPAPPDPAPAEDPALTAEPTPAGDPLTADTLLADVTSLLTAPTMSVSGNTVSWTPIPGVGSYVFVRKVPNQTPQYSIVSGTSATPPAIAGTTVSYGVRTNVSGSSWAREVSITYAASPSPSPSPQPIDGTFQMGVAAGSALSYELSFVKLLGAHTARLTYGIGTSASSMASVIDAYARAGIRPLLLATFYGRTPTSSEAQSLAGWAAAYGPGGTFWQGKTYPANTAVTSIEFGNETSYSYQFSDNSSSAYAARAQAYALRARDAANAIHAANARVGLLVQGDNAQQQTAWVQNMFRAVPNLDDLAAGWTIHPYGPSWATRIDSTISSTRTAGARDLPIWITEWGLSSDNGRCLSDNYGYNRCMTYSEAASTLHNAVAGMQSRYGTRLGAFFLYQAHDQYATGTQSGREAYFGATQSNGTAKGAYTTEVKADLAVN